MQCVAHHQLRHWLKKVAKKHSAPQHLFSSLVAQKVAQLNIQSWMIFRFLPYRLYTIYSFQEPIDHIFKLRAKIGGPYFQVDEGRIHNSFILFNQLIMELEESEIINLAVNIFQNVGIKRYIGQIEALRHEDIYFEIYKIIFPDSMINIFKISESNLTTGQKIQKIIEEISSIIKLDLYHISGEAIAQGNRNHLTNWLQLLEALSNNYFQEYQTYHGGGSEPDRDREYLDLEESENDYYTVQGVHRQFDKHTYTDEKADDSDDEQEESEPVIDQRKYPEPANKEKRIQNQSSQPSGQDDLNRSFRKSDSSRNSNVLQPIEPKKKISNKNKLVNKNKKVTFKIEEGQQNSHKNQAYSKKVVRKNSNQAFKVTAPSLYEPGEEIRVYKKQNKFSNGYGNRYPRLEQQEKLLKTKKSFISKMHKIEQQMERKKINDEIARFQKWVMNANQLSVMTATKIEEENRHRTDYISRKIAEREDFIGSIAGKQQAEQSMKKIFKKQRQNEKRMKRVMLEEERKAALELMDLNFAAEVENMVMASIGQ